ncbi:MAG: hypothetical protein L0H94_05165 [Nitrospira sp.]|nr:hypothetical protein [Nitrospira sp.]
MRYEAKDQVFVAMPFSAPFRRAFERTIEPAINLVSVNGRKLIPRIINRATSGSPDIHEQIFDAILHSRLVIADMTVQSSCAGDDGTQRWQPNANVAYEVGLAAAWRNPEDILLIHRGHPDHSYSFDVQNLRHIQYDPEGASSVAVLTDEIVRALNQSSFLAKMAYQKILESVSPTAIQFMHLEARRAFPVVAFQNENMPIMDGRIHAATELLSYGALKNRHVLRQGSGKGVAVIYEWTELGLRMLLSLYAITTERSQELRRQIASVPVGTVPPPALRDLPEARPPEKGPIDMVDAAKVDTVNEPATAK